MWQCPYYIFTNVDDLMANFLHALIKIFGTLMCVTNHNAQKFK